MWHRLSLRTRILLGYGLGLLVMAGLVGFLILRMEQIQSQIAEINATTAEEAELGAQLAARSAQVQQHVDRYLQQPQQANRAAVQLALSSFAQTLEQHDQGAASAAQGARIRDLADRLERYRQAFVAIDSLIGRQSLHLAAVNQNISLASSLLNRYMLDRFETNTRDQLALLQSAQSNLQAANVAAGRTLAEQRSDLADLALTSLRLSQTRLQDLNRAQESDINLQSASDWTSQAISATIELAGSVNQLSTMRSGDLAERSGELQRSADAIAQGALGSLTGATERLEQRLRVAEQAAGIALLLTLAGALAAGAWLASTFTRPLNRLAAATERINHGELDHRVDVRDRGEIGRLAHSFNQMTSTLRRQRDEVAAQQAAMAERNRELEQALEQVQRANAEREALASTIRQISVPIIPILKHVLVVPLVGEIDHERMQVLTRRLLEGVASQRARLAILDITGVSMLDEAVAQALLRAAAAVELLGARALLAGIRPEVAQALVASDIDLRRFDVTADLRAAVELALRAERP